MQPDEYLARLRALCARLPECAEKTSWGHPNFTARGRIFASFGSYGGRPNLGIATTREEQAFLVEDPHFAIAPYVGSKGWVIAWLDREPEWEMLADLLERAHARTLAAVPKRRAVAKPRARPRNTSSRPAGKRKRPARAPTRPRRKGA